MNSVPSFSDDEIDALVLRHLEKKVESYDPRPLFARIQNDVAQINSAPLSEPVGGNFVKWNGLTTTGTMLGWMGRFTSSRTLRRFVYATASLASIVFLAIVLRFSVQESAAAVVRETRLLHALPVDRCYLVEVQSRGTESADRVTVNRTDRLWTRGDQFFLESTNIAHRWAWGRDEAGAYWTTYGRREGLKLEPAEIPDWLDTSCNIRSMRLETMLDEVLLDFTLAWENDAAHPGLKVVRAVGNPGRRQPKLKEVRLEIDSETRVLHKAIVSRWDKQNQIVFVTFTLVGMEAQPDGNYHLETRLDQPSEIYTRTNKPEKRLEIMTKIFGPEAVSHWPGITSQPAASFE